MPTQEGSIVGLEELAEFIKSGDVALCDDHEHLLVGFSRVQDGKPIVKRMPLTKLGNNPESRSIQELRLKLNPDLRCKMPTEELPYTSPYNKSEALTSLKRMLVRGNPHEALQRLQDECKEIFGELGLSSEIRNFSLGTREGKYSASFIYHSPSGRGNPEDANVRLSIKYDSGDDQFHHADCDGFDVLADVVEAVGREVKKLRVAAGEPEIF